MVLYELRYCTGDGRLFAKYDFEADDDEAATARARFLARLKSPSFELWQGRRLVHREGAG
jgi:hypothetical protein